MTFSRLIMRNSTKNSFLLSFFFFASLLPLILSGGVWHQPKISFLAYATGLISLYVLALKKESPLPSLSQILLIAFVLRLAFCTYPISDDVNRYAWEGMMAAKGMNPYVEAPAEYASQFSHDPIFQGINHKEVSTIYPPVAMLIFSAISWIFYSLESFRLFFLLCDMGIIFLLSRLLAFRKLPPQWVILYAWNPLILLYGVGEAHIDILHLFFVALCLLRYEEKKEAQAFFWLGSAVMTKYLSIILLPYLFFSSHKKNALFFFLPFFSAFLYFEPAMLQGLNKFSGEMSYNDFFARAWRNLLGQGTEYRLAMLTFCALGLIAILYKFHQQRMTGMALSWRWLILCLPTIHPWYLIPIIFFLALSPSLPWMVFSITIGFSFWNLHAFAQTGIWQELDWVWWAVYLPFLLAYLGMGARRCFAKNPKLINSIQEKIW